MEKKYWLDLFTGETWEEFLNFGADVSGFSEHRKAIASKIHPGDYLICYLTGISRFVGVLEVLSELYYDKTPRWKNESFPIRFKVNLILRLTPKTAVPVSNLSDKLSVFAKYKPGKGSQWTGFFRGSPALFKQRDGELVVDAIRAASLKPVEVEFDERKYPRKPKKYHSATDGSLHVTHSVAYTKEIDEDEQKAHQGLHNRLRDMLFEIGKLEGRISEKEYPIEEGRLDVAWMKISGGKPMAVFEVQVGGNFYQALAKLKHACDIWNSKPFLVTSEKYRSKAMIWIKGTFHEMEKDLRIVDSDRVEELYNTIKKARDIKEELGIDLK